MALPPQWISMIIAIEESKDLTELPIDDLIGSLLTDEMEIGKVKAGGSRLVKNRVALKSTEQ